MGWSAEPTHSPLIGGRALQLAGVYDADDHDTADADAIMLRMMLRMMIMRLIMPPPTSNL